MMEKKFLLYLIYIAFIEIRAISVEKKDERLYWISDLLHNIPFQLETEENSKDAYETVLRKVKHSNKDGWFELRKKEFYERYPQFEGKL